jgi:hypothetical protein
VVSHAPASGGFETFGPTLQLSSLQPAAAGLPLADCRSAPIGGGRPPVPGCACAGGGATATGSDTSSSSTSGPAHLNDIVRLADGDEAETGVPGSSYTRSSIAKQLSVLFDDGDGVQVNMKTRGRGTEETAPSLPNYSVDANRGGATGFDIDISAAQATTSLADQLAAVCCSPPRRHQTQYWSSGGEP